MAHILIYDAKYFFNDAKLFFFNDAKVLFI